MFTWLHCLDWNKRQLNIGVNFFVLELFAVASRVAGFLAHVVPEIPKVQVHQGPKHDSTCLFCYVKSVKSRSILLAELTDSCEDWNSTTIMFYYWGFATCMGLFHDTVQESASKLSTAHWNTACSGCQEDGHRRSTCAIKDSWMFSQVFAVPKLYRLTCSLLGFCQSILWISKRYSFQKHEETQWLYPVDFFRSMARIHGSLDASLSAFSSRAETSSTPWLDLFIPAEQGV